MWERGTLFNYLRFFINPIVVFVPQTHGLEPKQVCQNKHLCLCLLKMEILYSITYWDVSRDAKWMIKSFKQVLCQKLTSKNWDENR